MVDVKHLYLAARDVRTAALIGVIVFVVLLFLLARVKALPMLCKAFLTVSAFFLAAVMTAGLWAAVDFSSVLDSLSSCIFHQRSVDTGSENRCTDYDGASAIFLKSCGTYHHPLRLHVSGAECSGSSRAILLQTKVEEKTKLIWEN